MRLSRSQAGACATARAATAHPIHEHARAREAEQQLSRFADRDLEAEPYQSCADRLGLLMYESHAGYSACGPRFRSHRRDRHVRPPRRSRTRYLRREGDRGRQRGPVAILARADAGPLVQGIADRCARRWGSTVRVLSGTSSGAAACGVCALSV